MRKDIKIKVNNEGNLISVNSKIMGISSENLQGKIIFKPEPFIEGTCRMYIEGRGSISMEKEGDCYIVDILSSLLIESSLDICFKITEPQNEKGIPVFCSKKIHLRVLDTIESDEEIPDQYPSWIETFDSKIAEMQALEETVEIAENTREENENARIQAEQNRANAETERNNAEQNRIENEDERISNEDSRILTENKRITNESFRNENERRRQSNELARNENEEIRIANEKERELAEQNREEATQEAISNIRDLSDEYEQLAEEKTEELNTIADGVKDLATAIQFATFDVDDDMQLGINTAEKMSNTSFDFDEENGELEVEII